MLNIIPKPTFFFIQMFRHATTPLAASVPGANYAYIKSFGTIFNAMWSRCFGYAQVHLCTTQCENLLIFPAQMLYSNNRSLAACLAWFIGWIILYLVYSLAGS
jgi:hypothetical protein